jgi:pyridoxal phosphate enzyme (YggS family)
LLRQILQNEKALIKIERVGSAKMIHDRIQRNLEEVRVRIAQAAARAGRSPGDVRLVAVTKKSAPEWIRALLDCGVFDLGENYPQELWKKSENLADQANSIRWHLIGHLQTNKVKKTLPMVNVIHSVDSLKLLRVLDEAARTLASPPSVCLQVNTSCEVSKHGWSAEGIINDCESIAACRSIPVVGLMTMAALDGTDENTRAAFASLRETRDMLRQKSGLPLPELSMGMSGDFELAILEGATLVRIGTALFEGLEP